MNDLTFTDEWFSDYIYWQIVDRKTVKRINNLLEDIKQNGAMQGIGKPEPLKQRPGFSVSKIIDMGNRWGVCYDSGEPPVPGVPVVTIEKETGETGILAVPPLENLHPINSAMVVWTRDQGMRM